MPTPLRLLARVFAVLLLAGTVHAAIVVPNPDPNSDFGELSDADFNPGPSSGISNDAVAFNTFTHGGNVITVGLTAHPRGNSNPPVTNNGAGTFYVTPGTNLGTATWNFGYYFLIDGSGDLSNYDIDLLYDFDPSAGPNDADHGVIHFSLGLDPSTQRFEDSQNLSFGFLATGFPPAIIPPNQGPFDPNVAGEYTFALRVYDASTNEFLGETTMAVLATPEPFSLAIWGGIGLVGLAASRLRRKKVPQAL